jgi:hypothetical protein
MISIGRRWVRYYSQSRGAFDTKFAMEYKHGLLGCITAGRRPGLISSAKEKFFYTCGRIDVDGAWDVPAVVLVVETTVDDMIFGDLRVVCAI